MRVHHHVWGAVGLISLVGACSAEDEPAGETPNVGEPASLRILVADPVEGLKGLYTRGEHGIYFEAVREQELEPEPALSPDGGDDVGPNIGVVLTDLAGDTIVISSDSHTMLPHWTRPAVEERRLTARDLYDRQRALDLAPGLAAALEAAALDAALAPEVRDVAAVARSLPPPHERARTDAGDFIPDAAIELADVDAPVPAAYSGYYRQWFNVRHGTAWFGAHQCSVWHNEYKDTSGNWWFYDRVDNRNHGGRACYDEPDSVCVRQTAQRTYRLYTINCESRTGYCVTGFNCHNCRTDTEVQKRWVVDRIDSRNSQCDGARVQGVGCNPL